MVASGRPKALRTVQDLLVQESLASFVRSELLVDLSDIEVDPRSSALPLAIQTASLWAPGDVRRTESRVTAPIERDEAAVEVSVDIDTTIVVEARTGPVLGDDFAALTDRWHCCGGSNEAPSIHSAHHHRFARPARWR